MLRVRRFIYTYIAREAAAEAAIANLSTLVRRAPSSRDLPSPDEAVADPGEVLEAATDDPRYEKYKRMLKMGVPAPAVDMKMVAEGVDVYVLLYREFSESLQAKHRSGDHARSLRALSRDGRGRVYVLRHPRHLSAGQVFWSHHEKVCVVDQRVAFVGGMDLCEGRYDDLAHGLRDDCEPHRWPGAEYYQPNAPRTGDDGDDRPRNASTSTGGGRRGCPGRTSPRASTAAPRSTWRSTSARAGTTTASRSGGRSCRCCYRTATGRGRV